MTAAYGIAVIGTSWGGLAALRNLVSTFPHDLPIPVVIVQHRHPQSDAALATLLQDRTKLRVCEVEDQTPIEGGRVYVAPADYHLLVEPGHFSLSVDEPIRYSRPSIDVTFVSTSEVYGRATIGVVLTGANADGSLGLRRIVNRGGVAIVQDPDSAESPAMPAAALKAVPSATVLPLAAIGALIADLVRQGAASAGKASHLGPEARP